ncbi:MAG: SRPBCC family protein [Microthrixaceae bacterium]|nr:SRPBCC family protein [Microthrixaceae bacterium]
MGRLSDQDYADEVSERIEASPEVLYELVSDLPRMGRFSPENRGGRWIGSPRGPVVDARFLGLNRRGLVAWATISKVVVADPGREFAFEVPSSGAKWTYRFEADGESTLVTECRESFRKRPLVARLFAGGLLGGIGAHDHEMREGMAATLERLKAVAEAG